MPKVKPCVHAAALALAFAAIVCEARDLKPADLLERHIEARGGRKALEQLQYVERFGSFHAHAGANEVSGTYHTCLKYPDHVAISIDAGPIQIHRVLIENVALECKAGFTDCYSAPQVVHALLCLKDSSEDIKAEVWSDVYGDFMKINGGGGGPTYKSMFSPSGPVTSLSGSAF